MARHRSPPHPYLSIENALAIIQKVYDNERRHPVPVEVIAKHAGYKDLKSSSALRVLGTLNHYGLVEETGSGEDRKMKLSERALDIVLADATDSPKRLKAIRDAVLQPEVHRRILEAYPDELPSDSTLKNFLIRDLNFNDDQADPFIGKFRKSVDFAGVCGKNLTGEPAGEKDDDPENEKKPPAIPPKSGDLVVHLSDPTTPRTVAQIDDTGEWALLAGDSEGVPVSELEVVAPADITVKPPVPAKPASQNPFTGKKPPKKPDGPFISFPLTNDNNVELRLTSRVSKKDFERLKKLIDLSEDSLVESGDDEADE